MADLPRYPGPPRWVKVFGIIFLVVALLFAILHVARGPGGHTMSGAAGGHALTQG